MKNSINELIDSLLQMSVVAGKRIIFAVLFFILISWVISWTRKGVRKILIRKNADSTVASFINSLVNVGLKTLMAIAIVGILGVETTSFAAILGALGLAIGMAMKDNLANFAGGVMILLNKPFKLGDRIVAQSMDGTVIEIGILYTVLLTGDNRTIFLPNGKVSTGSIINYSTQDRRRVDITLTIGTGEDLDLLKQILNEIVLSEKKILETPTPSVGIAGLNNGTFDVSVKVWTKSSDAGGVTTFLNEVIYKKFMEHGIYTSSVLKVKMV